MIHQVIIPEKNHVHIQLDFPNEYIGKEIEIIAFEKNEGLAARPTQKKFQSFERIQIDTTDFIFNRDEANER